MNFKIEQSDRYLKAKYAEYFKSKNFRISLLFIALALALSGLFLVFTKNWFGWLIFIPSVVIFIVHEWWRWDLNNIDPISISDKPDQLLSQQALAKLKPSYDNLDAFIDDLSKTNDYWFLANRFLLTNSLIKQTSPNPNWWDLAIKYYNDYNTPEGLTAAHIVVALILSSDNKAQILSASGNKEEDLLQGLKWFAYVKELISSVNIRKSSGGIARDWAAGYTPLLNNFATNISLPLQNGNIGHREISGHQNVISQMVTIFSSNTKQNCALVGEVGVGKNACVQAFAESLLFSGVASSIKYNQIYQIDIANVLTKISDNQIDYTIQQLCIEAFTAKNIILFFDNAGAFFGLNGGRDITNIILPIIEGGRVRMIFSFTTNQWQIIQKTKPSVAAALNYQAVLPTDESDTLRILENQTLFTESQNDCTFSYEALKEVYRLAERYGPDIAMPERAISVLEDVARSNQGTLIGKQQVQQTLEKTTGIKIATVNNNEKQKLINLEEELHKRVVGQNAAVKQIASALKRSRTGVGNQNKPIGTYLFLGPTGVGKTEVSKTLAKVYFGGNDGIVRLDMNEYITKDSVHKLLAPITDQGSSFLESIRKKPFSVVLFDEIEKAHPNIVNVFLQLLDEGTIKDADNKIVSFKDAIIIATSNAGAEIIRQKITEGASTEEIQNKISDELIASGIFKPEFINRFDDVIVFAPLSKSELLQIVNIMLNDINNQLSNQGISVELTDDAVNWLASQGYDERLGARPLRRMMQQTVENFVSDLLLKQDLPSGSKIVINSQQLSEINT